MKILFIGDITGKAGRQAVQALVPGIKKKHRIDFAVANAENAAGGSGITPPIAEELLGYGLDVLTSGDHIWKRREIMEIIDREPRILRPANYPSPAHGQGAGVYESANGIKIGVLNLLGRVFMNAVDCPFRTARDKVKQLKAQTPVILVDFHAEATSEKIALGFFLDGEVSAVVGSHTHVQTADENILPRGTAYITDAGMTGPFDSVIGRRAEQIIERFITQMPVRFEMATGNIQLHGVIIDIDAKTGKATAIKRVQERLAE